jgi:crotonobetainyl-CoA:carnitine CoA-transferase CaiB-like acyl-CoA transferase
MRANQADDRGRGGLLSGVRVLECSLLGPAAITTHLADLGADVIKIEPPQGDYVRQMTWPIVEGVSLMHLHVNRGKRSLTLDLRKPEAVDVFLQLARSADAVVEAMRPGALERRGLGYDRLREVNPGIVFITISGYGMTGPYRATASRSTPGPGSCRRRSTSTASRSWPSIRRWASTRDRCSARSGSSRAS